VKRETAAGRKARGAAASAQAVADLPVLAPKLNAIEIATLTVAVVVAVTGAHLAQAFLVPVIVGILLSYTLRPLVSALERWRVPRLAGAALVIVVLAGLVTATGYAIRADVNSAVAELPGAARKLRLATADAARRSDSPITNVKAAAAELDRAASAATGEQAPAVEGASSNNMTGQIQAFVSAQTGKALAVISEMLVAILLAFFLLAAGDTFRRKVAHLAGASLARRRITIEVMNEIDTQIQRYMVTLLVANGLIALATWAVLFALGLPNPGMWGAFAGVLHFIPYVGTVVTAGGVGIAMFAYSGSFSDAAVASALVGGVAFVIGMGLTTWMQGRTSRMNPVAVFVGILFFGWLWGGWGLLLGVPILAVVKSISDRVDSLHPVSEFLAA
jgi:predicted PurR-regulated permease PerM